MPSPPSTVPTPDLEQDELLEIEQDGLLEEQQAPFTQLRCFYPMVLGDVLHHRYQVTAKLGYGGRSTVWLAKDLRRWKWQKTRYVAIKVAVAGDFSDGAVHDGELQVLREITKTNPKHPGYKHILTLQDSFYTPSSAGQHLALVFEPLREPVRLIKRYFEGDKLPVTLVKVITFLTLQALDYLHSECHIIHCDISESNILFRFGDNGHKSLQEHSQLERTNPLPVKRLANRTIHLSHNCFGDLEDNIGGCMLTDFDGSVGGGEDEEWNHDIQPTGMAAPEVLLRAKWGYSADIWNLGVLLCGLMEGKPIFDDDAREHWSEFSEADSMARMIAFLAPPPQALLSRAERLSEFYDEHGSFKSAEAPIPQNCSFDKFFTRIEGDEKRAFISFVRRMLMWMPGDRAKAKQLLSDPWLQGIR